jgi:acetyl esterase
VDGQRLAPEAQIFLRLLWAAGDDGRLNGSIADIRVLLGRLTRVVAGAALPGVSVERLTIPGPAGPLPGRLYVPDGLPAPAPLAVHYHGGGWVLGDLDTHDQVCRFLAARARVRVLAVDYRLAPEHRFPAGVEDCLATFRFAVKEARRLGIDRRRIAVVGDSAGGNLAAVVAQLTLAEGDEVTPAMQVLLYPAVDGSTKRPSYKLAGSRFIATEARIDWAYRHYLPNRAAARDPRVSPLLAKSLRGLAPALVVTAGFDPLRDEGEAYARRLKRAGVPTTLVRVEDLPHGFANAPAIGRRVPVVMGEVAAALSAGLAPARRRNAA